MQTGKPLTRVVPLLLAALAACRSGAAEPRASAAVTLADTAAGNPTAAVDPRGGAAYVAWVSAGEGARNVFLAQAEGAAFSAPVRVNDVDGDAAPHEQAPAQVAVGPQGHVYVLWQNNRDVPGRRFPASDLRFARSTDGGRTFEPAVTVNDDADGAPSSHTFHQLAVGADGTVFVSWIDSRARDAERARRAAANPQPAAEAVPGTPAKAQGGHGGHGGMKEDPTLPGPEVRVARSTDGGRTFGASVVVDADACPCCRTSMAVGPDGSLYVSWRKVYPGDVRDVVVARLAPGADTFTAPVRVAADGWVFPGCPHAGPSLAMDARGRLHVGWYTGKEGRQGLWHAVSADGGRSFGPPTALLTAEWVPPSLVALVPDGAGVLAAWDDRRQPESSLTLARIGADGEVERMEARPEGRAPALAAGRGGVLFAWHQGQAVRALRIAGD